MLAYIIRRCFIGAIMLVLMSMVTYILFFASPVDPTQYACGKGCTPEKRADTRKNLGYDKPAMVQWAEFAKGVVVGRDYPNDAALRKARPDLVTHCAAPCLGYSVFVGETVNKEVSQAFPISLSLAITAFIMWIVGGVLFGVIAAQRQGTFTDRGIVGLSLLFYAFPTFFTGLFLYKFVALKWHLVPSPSYVSIADGGLGAWFVGLLLPGFTLALVYMAGYVRMTRAFVLEAASEDYLRTARAKGLNRFKVLVKHCMRAALTPLVTMAGLDLAGLMGGAIITETVFNYNGLGKLAVTANANYDLPTIIGLVLLLAAVVIIANIVVDILYAVIDPRVRVG